MSITEDELVDAYGSSNAEERFDLIYENYSVFPQLVDCFEIGLFNTILNEKEYNRRAKNSADLGVRVQTSNKSDPNENDKVDIKGSVLVELSGHLDTTPNYLLGVEEKDEDDFINEIGKLLQQIKDEGTKKYYWHRLLL